MHALDVECGKSEMLTRAVVREGSGARVMEKDLSGMVEVLRL